VDDIIGEAGAQKEVEQIANSMKESKSTKSFESFEFLASITTFPTPFDSIMNCIEGLLDSADSLHNLGKIEHILYKVSAGVLRNKTIEPKQVLIFIYQIYHSNNSIKKSKGSSIILNILNFFRKEKQQ
jgi:U3 small nucleolar RNA-associated protein 20